MNEDTKKIAIEFAAAAAFSILREAIPELDRIMQPQIEIEHYLRLALNDLLNPK